MRKDKTELAEKLFQQAYQQMEREQEEALTTDGKFLKPLNKAASLGNPKANFLIGYILSVGYKDINVNVRRGSKILKKWFGPLKDLVEITHDYQACKFLSEYYRIPLAGHVKDDSKVESLLQLSDTYRNSTLNQPVVQDEEISPLEGNEVTKVDNLIFDQLIRAIQSLDEENTYDSKEQINIIKTSAQNGNLRAALFLGDCYMEGRYVMQNKQVAVEYYELAERLGSLKAKFKLGKHYVEGDYAKADVSKGLNKIYQAAKGGLCEAQYYLGQAYYEGKLLNRDLSKAYIYFQASWSRGYKPSKEYIRMIEEQSGDALILSRSN